MVDAAIVSFVESYGIYAVLGTAVAGLLYALLLIRQTLKHDEGTEKMKKVNSAIMQGSKAYLSKQFRSVLLPVAFLAIALYFTASAQTFDVQLGRAGAFLMGALFSGSVGYIGMTMAVKGNVRVASAARRSFTEALKIAYRTGTITGMLTDGLGLLGGTIIFMLYGPEKAFEVLLGFGFGGSLMALFLRVGGGIYTKSADVGADLVGKVEQGIPEDDPRNPAVIADLVGDNVGDCAGMAADIFESYEVSIVAAMILGLAAFPGSVMGVMFPLVVRAIGVLSSIIGTYVVTAGGKGGESHDAMRAIKKGFNVSALISTAGFFLLSVYYMDSLGPFFATLTGVLLAVAINYQTDFFTSKKFAPVKEIAKSALTGPATVVLSGLSTGYEATVAAILLIAAAIVGAGMFYGATNYALVSYSIALAGIGFLTLTGNNVSMDAFGPISDNASGIGEMAGLEPKARHVLDELDSVGNSTKAITKGIAIGSAVLAAISLFNSYFDIAKITTLSLNDPMVFVGLLIGGSVPFLFSSVAIRAVSRGAISMVNEVRRQFKTRPGIMKGTEEPDYGKCVEISTAAAQHELLTLGAIAILSPLIVGFGLHEYALGGFLVGSIVTGSLLAIFMSTTGGAWDNAKKLVESGEHGGKGSDAHKAVVVGDTIGDPLKDTAGPALNPMLKVINLISVMVVPMMIAYKSDMLVSGAAVAVCGAGIVWAIWQSRKTVELK
ncbi:MAG: sodium-translocating pyrophosphatase [Candidatus Aenigmarchaeota archaeon]|nr:sodium-translocating pyrophosphatase [Candidatus Aenigmarchaeota archaeon]